ncbi:hypothetical protein [Cellulomonas sp. GbtcB1]|uniref:hypothetical protein n=1 Tax=Cellulomonas sp. GbtcB1 TaxID=2824746 RepID=UPI001C2F42A4|nr:hypothetical protein [Cellulomonas sp. GbtcB1]
MRARPDSPPPRADHDHPDPPRAGEGETDPPPPGAAHAGRRRAARVLSVLLVAVVAAGWGVLRERDARAAEAHDQATAALAVAAGLLRDARHEGRSALAGSAGRVADNAVRTDLAALLVELPATAPDPDLPRAAATTWALAQSEAATDRAGLISEAASAVRSAQDAWEHDRARDAHAAAVQALTHLADEARAALAASEGRVLDDAVRDVLAAALAEADEALGSPVPEGTAALDAAAATAGERADALAVARADVAAAEEAWQAEQDRLAAERAAAARAQASSSAGTRGTAGTASGGTRPAGGSSGGSTTGTGGGRYDGWLSRWSPGDPVPDGWTVVVETEGGGWGGDEFGNVWELD